MPSAKNIAHRGSSHFAPENTWPAFERAVEIDGADGLELDVQLGGDGEVYVLHDPTVDRTTNGHGRLRDMDAWSIAALDAGHHFVAPDGSFSFRGQSVGLPKLRNLLEHFASTWFSIDLKQGGHEIESAVARILLDTEASKRCVIGAENPDAARRLARMLPPPEFRHFFDPNSVRRFYLRHRLHCWWSYDPPARSLQIPVSAGRWRLDRRRLIEDARRLGVEVIYWTVDDADEMRQLFELGCAGIITNRPDVLRDVLVERERS